MKQNFKNAALAIGIMALAFTGCKKELLNLDPAQTDGIESDIQALATQTESEGESLEITWDEATGEMAAANEGIAADYLVTEEDLDVNPGSEGPNSSTRNVRDHSFIRCLHDLKLDED